MNLRRNKHFNENQDIYLSSISFDNLKYKNY